MASAQPTRILVRGPNWIGDQVMAYPFYYHLRRAYPQAFITVACVSWVKDLQFLDLIDEVFVLPTPAGSSIWDRLKAVDEGGRKIAASGRWDLAIALPNSFSAAWFLKRSGSATRRGYRAEGRTFLLNDRVAFNSDSGIHRSQAYQDLLPTVAAPAVSAPEFWGIEPENDFDAKIPGILDRFSYEKSWSRAKQIEPPSSPYFVLGPGATAWSRRWPVDRFRSLAKKVSETLGLTCVIVGSKAEIPLAEELMADRSVKWVDLTDSGPVTGLARLFEGAKFTVTNESGLAHVASLCGSMVQIVCGAADPKRTKPIGPGRVTVRINPVACWPCERNSCANPEPDTIACLKGIIVDDVWKDIESGIRRIS